MMMDDPQDTAALIAAARKAKAPSDDTATLIAKARAQKPKSLPTDANNQATPDELAAAGGDDEQPGIAGSIADAAQGIPGVGALEAGVRSVARQQPYREAYGDIKRQTDKVPTSAKIIGRVAGGSPLARLLPASPIIGGAILGGAEQVLDANPDKGVLGRALTGTAGAAGGALGGKVLDMMGSGIRAVAAPVAAKGLRALATARSAASKPLYSAAMKEGAGGATVTPKIYDFLAKPDVAEIVKELKQTRTFANTPEDAPEMLDAVYKVFSDRGQQIKQGLETVAPNRPNIGRFRGDDVGLAKEEALNAFDTAMPSYRPATKAFAEGSGNMDAFRKGYDTQRMASGVPTGKNLDRTTPEALGEWAARRSTSDAQRDLAGEGARGAAGALLRAKPFTRGRQSVGELSGVLRMVGDKRQAQLDLLAKLGLIGGDAAFR